jgi:hypothetical protein
MTGPVIELVTARIQEPLDGLGAEDPFEPACSITAAVRGACC